ncbi:MAG: hypothetical protein CMG63_04785 [Candidatus Marinimicrobia bacterium]|nr:hypothetical protein [Candidatus Neomarinimicrobiota bacterium]|tara:strand:+ start:421 stop:1338 length:918 start_codon:yes stop_codon:yes gene_type:complete
MERVNLKKREPNILILGASGNIGSYLSRKIAKEKFSVISTTFSSKKNHGKSIYLNLCDKGEVELFFKKFPKFEVIIFLVGLAHKKGKKSEFDAFRKHNTETLVITLETLKNQNKLPKKLIFASTISVYGEKIRREIYDEKTERCAESPYAITKIESENYLIENFKSISWILRFAPVYSENFTLNIDRRTRIHKFYYKVGNGDKKLSLCNIKNIEKSVFGIIDHKIPAGTYNISDLNAYSYEDLLAYKGAKKIIFVPKLLVQLIYYTSILFDNKFLYENSIKLISNNIFSSQKIQQYIKLPFNLNE